ncbi:MAG: hypothetical protein FD123_1662 [Bacteroidetes bacterium]|nr:MAG: hypothetical protein FD123_1662 [Bacteroidota bacterium]
MQLTFVHGFQSEWLKKKRSAASWLVIIGGFFIPLLILAARIIEPDNLYAENTSPHVWEKLFHQCWQFMALFLLPMGVILATSLVTQLEFRNNTWKQLHAAPQGYTVVFFSKLAVILVMMLQFFVLFNIGIYLAGMLPAVFFAGVPFPPEPFPLAYYLEGNLDYFTCCLPIIGLQYLLSMQFRNFLIPLGAGIGLLVAGLIGVSWKYGYTIPYSYCALSFIGKSTGNPPAANIHLFAAGYFVLFTIAGYFIYITKKEKG